MSGSGPDVELLTPLLANVSETGVRRKELMALRVGSFDLAIDRAVLNLRAEATKSGKAATLPLSKDLAEALRGFLRTRHPSEPAFHLPPFWRASEPLQGDLAAAGVPIAGTSLTSTRCDTRSRPSSRTREPLRASRKLSRVTRTFVSRSGSTRTSARTTNARRSKLCPGGTIHRGYWSPNARRERAAPPSLRHPLRHPAAIRGLRQTSRETSTGQRGPRRAI